MLYIIGMTGKQLKNVLEANGWNLDRISGSHHIMVREGRRSIPIPVHGSVDLPKGASPRDTKAVRN